MAPELIALLVAAAIAQSACGHSPPLPGPSEAEIIPTTRGPIDITGTVDEFGASGERRAVANLRLKIRTGGPDDTPNGDVELPDVVTDSNGRYVIRDVSASMLFLETAPGSEHRFLCRDYPLLGNVPGFRPSSVDLPVVHVTWSGERMPPGMWNVGTSVSGKVLERQGETLQPIAGATVIFADGGREPPATTNASGFYMVCSLLGSETYRTISAHKPGYGTAMRRIFGGWDYTADFELTREW